MSITIAVVFGMLSVGQIDSLVHVGSLTEGVRSPARVAVDAAGNVLVTDTLYDHIARYDAAGAYLGVWPVPDGPVGIAVHPDGRIFVSYRDDPRVGVYDAAFTFQHFLAEGVVTFSGATDLDVAVNTGRIYVVDSAGDRVYGFDSDETWSLMFGLRGERPGEFHYPSAISVDETTGRLFVADHDNFRVQIFSTAGVFVRRFGYRNMYLPNGTEEGWMPRPQGLAIDSAGLLYVTDAMMGTVRVYNASGTHVGKVVDYGTGAGDVRTPCDLEISPDGSLLYVVSTNTSSVEIYQTTSLRNAGVSSLPNRRQPAGTNYCAYDYGYFSDIWLPAELDDCKRGGRSTDRGLSSALLAPSPLNPVETPTLLSTYDGPHILSDATIICGRCHAIDNQPGGLVSTVAGQEVLCMSCHSAGGQGLAMAIHEADRADPYNLNPGADGQGRSHAWGVSAVNALADSVGPAPGGAMEDYLSGGVEIKCTTCHNQHSSEDGAPYLRRSNAGDAMCKECHSPRNLGPGEGGSHAVGFDYPGGVGEFPPDGDLEPLVLKNGKVECTTCHGVHNADSGGANNGEGDGMLLRAANDETFCVTCHREHVGHTPGGDWQPTCVECHGVHDPNNLNLSLVGATVFNETLGANKQVVFTSRTGANSFDDGDPAANNGICQVCHTETTYHKHDGTGASHNDGDDCTQCHAHASGFMPSGGDCTSCHAGPQDNGDNVPVGGRRAVVGEFPVGDAHAHYGAALTPDACVVCHDQATHMDGYVDLIDPDDGSVYRFVTVDDLVGDPDLSDFCSGCHDADGAVRLEGAAMDPFGNGNTPPDVATRFLGTLQWDEWYGDFCFGYEGTERQVNSHHDLSDADQAWSGAKLECLNCHGAHTVSASQPNIDPFTALGTPTAWTSTDNGFCLTCHEGGEGPVDPGLPPGVTGPTTALRGIDSCNYQQPMWWVDYTWTNAAHGLDSKRQWDGYMPDPANPAPSYELNCQDCHDPHGSYTPTNTLGNPYMIRDFVDGTMYVDDGVRPNAQWTGPPWETFGVAREVVIDLAGAPGDINWGDANTGLCSVCHATWLSAYDWHSYCSGCQTCHGHGMAYQNYDWGPGNDDDVGCPTGRSTPQWDPTEPPAHFWDGGE